MVVIVSSKMAEVSIIRAAQGIEKEFHRRVIKEIKKRLTAQEVFDAYKLVVTNRFKKVQALFSGVADEDPTAPYGPIVPWEALIDLEIKAGLRRSASALKADGVINIEILSDKFLGLNTQGPKNTKDPSPVKWMYFFIVTGLQQELYWVSKEKYPEVFPGKVSDGELGRFGAGFLVHLNKFKSQAQRDRIKTHGVRHPQSGKPGDPLLFAKLTDEIQFLEVVVEPAVRAAEASFSKTE